MVKYFFPFLSAVLVIAGSTSKSSSSVVGFEPAAYKTHKSLVSLTRKNVVGGTQSFSGSAILKSNRHSDEKSSLRLYSTADKSSGDGTISSKELDVDALVKYGVSIAVQMGLLYGVTKGLDLGLGAADVSLPFPAAFVLFYGLSLKSRVFNPLDNERPNIQKASQNKGSAGFKDRVMPSFTPPGFIFPIAWILVNGPLRAYASALVYSATGALASPAILAFLFHLSVGDVWNTINNTEQRYGASATTVLAVWASAAYAAFMYSQVDPLAGKLLGGTLVWLTLASSLVITTWRINPDDEGKLDTLYPAQGETKTEFAWFKNSAED